MSKKSTLDLGSAIKQEREAIGLSISQLATILGVSNGILERWEAGLTFPSSVNRDKLLKELKINVDDYVEKCSPVCNTEFGRLLVEIRSELGMTRYALSKKINLTTSAVTNWETGKCLPSSNVILILIQKLSNHSKADTLRKVWESESAHTVERKPTEVKALVVKETSKTVIPIVEPKDCKTFVKKSVTFPSQTVEETVIFVLASRVYYRIEQLGYLNKMTTKEACDYMDLATQIVVAEQLVKNNGGSYLQIPYPLPRESPTSKQVYVYKDGDDFCIIDNVFEFPWLEYNMAQGVNAVITFSSKMEANQHFFDK